VEDFKFALRKDPKKLARVEELLFMTEDIARSVSRPVVLPDLWN
jgi:transcription initiation factor TFIID subunit 13